MVFPAIPVTRIIQLYIDPKVLPSGSTVPKRDYSRADKDSLASLPSTIKPMRSDKGRLRRYCFRRRQIPKGSKLSSRSVIQLCYSPPCLSLQPYTGERKTQISLNYREDCIRAVYTGNPFQPLVEARERMTLTWL